MDARNPGALLAGQSGQGRQHPTGPQLGQHDGACWLLFPRGLRSQSCRCCCFELRSEKETEIGPWSPGGEGWGRGRIQETPELGAPASCTPGSQRGWGAGEGSQKGGGLVTMGEGRESVGGRGGGVSSVRAGAWCTRAGQGKVRASVLWKHGPWTWSAF